MKVLFAVSNENISAQIVKKYQREYKEIISYKNMYYFNAIVKELQRDKSYDRIIIGEDLEPFSSNNYDAIDKFIFEKLDSISDEATGSGGDIPIILLCADRRSKSEPMLVKLFGLGIYNALLSPDKTLDNVCKLINKPRSKKQAKTYYRIDSEEVNYQSESENNVSELEIQNILKHYKRLGKDENKYIESFNNIAAQYNDAQLRIITKFLPLSVKAVLEEKSPKYQSVMTFGDTSSTINTMRDKKKEEGLKIGFLNGNSNTKPTKPVIVPTAVNKTARRLTSNKSNSEEKINKPINEENDFSSELFENIENFDDIKTSNEVVSVKRGRGRPKKNSEQIDNQEEYSNKPKRGRGRPKKDSNQYNSFESIDNNSILDNNQNTEFQEFNDDGMDSILPGFDDFDDVNSSALLDKEEQKYNEPVLPGFDEEDDSDSVLPGFEEDDSNDIQLSDLDNVEDDFSLPGFDEIESDSESFGSNNNVDFYSNSKTNQGSSSVTNYKGDNYYSSGTSKVDSLLSKDKKIVAFVGTTKNGTSFLVNNLGKTLANMGIKTAILDLTTNRNSYYIFTNNDERLRGIAYESVKKLRSGIASGISVEKNLDIYTALPGDSVPIEDVDNILSTLVQNYSLVLLDCDFSTPMDYFGAAQELYIVQSLDILTIQPMTAFLRELKAKEVLKEEKIRVIINKEVKIKGLTPNAIVGGLAFYNDPAMSFMTELFNKENVKYITIPFDEATYIKYLENVMECELSFNGYSKEFNSKIKELANMVYPLIGNRYQSKSNGYSYNNTFSTNMNSTLEQMKKKY